MDIQRFHAVSCGADYVALRSDYKLECWVPGGGKEGQDPKGKEKPKETAAAAATAEKKDEAWLVFAPRIGFEQSLWLRWWQRQTWMWRVLNC